MDPLEINIEVGDAKKNQKPQGDDLKKEEKKEEAKTSLEIEGEGNNAIAIGGNVGKAFIDSNNKVSINNEVYSDKSIKTRDIKGSQVIQGDYNNVIINSSDSIDAQALAEYGRFFQIGLCFYHGLRVTEFLIVLDTTQKYLSEKFSGAKKINFPSRHPDTEILEQFDDEKLAVTIKLKLKKKDSVEDYFDKRIKNEYTSELFNYTAILNRIVETQPNNWEIRWRSARGLGKISELDVKYVFNKLINVWAQDEKAFVRVTVAYYFYYILSEDGNLPEGAQKFLLQVFEKWANPKDFTESKWRYKWTVAAICEKLGHLKNDQAQTLANKYLEQVAGINHIRVADAVVHALLDWSIKEKFPQVFNFLVSWAERGSAGNGKEDNPFEIRCIVALIAFSVIIETHYEILSDENKKQEGIVPVDILKYIWEKRTKKENLWNGIVSIGVRYFDFKMGNYFFEMIEKWTEIVADTDFLIEFVSDWLKEIHIIKRPKHLENRLKNVWSKSKNKKLVSIAEMTHEKIKNSI